ncbi:MAG: transglutaminase-like domain-containing protein [Pirellulaceae bacterium]
MLRQKSTIAFSVRLVFLITITVLLGEFHSATYADEGIGAADPTPGLETALTQAGDNRSELEKALQEAQSDEEVRAVKFLIANMPETDLQSLSADYLLKNVRFAFKAKHQFPWGKNIPMEIFLNDVVPYASINERRDDWREDFYNRFAPLVKDCKTASEAAQKLNENVFGIVNVKYSTRRKKADQSPYESMEQGLASCTGLSVILTDACRAVGVPARMAGTPLWVNNRGNHTWVEIWDGEWKFTGASEPDPQGLNRGWFVDIASQEMQPIPSTAFMPLRSKNRYAVPHGVGSSQSNRQRRRRDRSV